MDGRIEKYREWLGLQVDLAESAKTLVEKWRPSKMAAERAKFHAKGLKETLEEFNRLFPPSAKTGGE